MVRINWVSEFPHANRDYMLLGPLELAMDKAIPHSILSSVNRWLEVRFDSLLLTPSRIVRAGIVLRAMSYYSGWPQLSKIRYRYVEEPEKPKYLLIGEIC